MSDWKPWFGKLDGDGRLIYGKFKTCTSCNKRLDSTQEDEEHLAYHGYCSRQCASEDAYGNYTF
jgi:hypothetical protein